MIKGTVESMTRLSPSERRLLDVIERRMRRRGKLNKEKMEMTKLMRYEDAAEIDSLTPGEIGVILDERHVSAKDFWSEAAGGDMVAMSRADVERVIESM